MRSFRRTISVLAAVCIAGSSLLAPAYATTISTEQLAATALTANHQRLHAALDRADLTAALQARGVSVEALRDRVGALTDAEAAQVLAQIDQAPAGGDVLGIIFTVFIVLLVTDVLGVTKVFPFTRSVR